MDRCAHWQPDWGAGQSHCRRCRKSATCALPQTKARSGSVAVAGVLEFLRRVRRDLSPVVDCSGGNAAAGQIFLAAMRSNPSAWGDTQRAKHQPQVEGLLNAALSVSSPRGGGDLRGACMVELGAGERPPIASRAFLTRRCAGKGILGRVLGSFFGGRSVCVERRDIFECHTFDSAPEGEGEGEDGTAAAKTPSTRVCVDVASIELPELFAGAAAPAAGVFVCAKHLCGVGTDLALDCIQRARDWPPLRGILIAPCCHQTIAWDALPASVRQWFSERGFEPSWWNALKLLVHLSKSGRPSEHFGSFGAFCDVPPLKLYDLGRLARRCIEEARCCRLRALGFAAAIFRYSPAAVTPDNLVIVSQRAPTAAPVPRRMPSAICSRNAPKTPAGVVLRLESADRARSVVTRLYASHRQAKGQGTARILFDVAWEQILFVRSGSLQSGGGERSLGDSELVVIVNCQDVAPLLAALHSDRVLRCAIRQIIPFSNQSSSAAVLQRDALSMVSKMIRNEKAASEGEDPAAVRLLCWPPPLLDELKGASAAAPCDGVMPSAEAATSAFALKLHPTRYSAAVCAVEWIAVDSASDEVLCDEVLRSYGQDFFDIEEAHRLAVETQQLQYTDSRTGWKVFSQLSSAGRGFCCGMGCRHCVFGHENMDSERKSRAKAPITINGARRSILWSVLSRDHVAQLLLPAAAFCSDSERSFERLSEVMEQDLLEVGGANIAIVRDDLTGELSAESQLTLELLQQRGASSVSQLVFKSGELTFIGTTQFGARPVPAPISVVVSFSKALSRTIRCEGSYKHSCTDLLRVLALFSTYPHLALAPDFSMMFRISRSPAFRSCKEADCSDGAAAVCEGQFSHQSDEIISTWQIEQVRIFHALSDRKFERTAVGRFSQRDPSSITPHAHVDGINVVQQLSALDLKAMKIAGVAHQLVDVRDSWEIEVASIPGARLLDADYQRELTGLPRDANLVFACHHGIRSRAAAETFLRLGFKNVFNLEGGVDAWSTTVDSTVPRY